MDDRNDIEDRIARLARTILKQGLSAEFRSLARREAETVSSGHFETLRHLLHDPPPEPEHYSVEEHGLAGWLSACQFAIFELLYSAGAAALPLVREIAWGEYDWTQGNAIELLLRFAADGLEREAIIGEVKANFPDIRYEAQLYALEPLVPRLTSEPALAALFAELSSCIAFAETVREIAGNR